MLQQEMENPPAEAFHLPAANAAPNAINTGMKSDSSAASRLADEAPIGIARPAISVDVMTIDSKKFIPDMLNTLTSLFSAAMFSGLVTGPDVPAC